MRTLLAGVSLALISSTALAQSAMPQYTSIWAIGDSLTDTGRTYQRTHFSNSTVRNLLEKVGLHSFPYGPNYEKGRFSNGPVWLEYLSTREGMSYDASRNLSWGGAVTGPAYRLSIRQIIPSLEDQTKTFISGLSNGSMSNYGGRPLVALWIGGNNFRQPYVDVGGPWIDVWPDVPKALQKSPYPQKDLILKNVPDDLRQINNAFLNRKDIGRDGVTYYVMTLPDASTSPRLSQLSPAQREELSNAITSMNREMKVKLYALGDEFARANPDTRIVVVDAAALFKEIKADRTAFGFSDVDHNCIDSETGNFVGNCSAAVANTYLFWDQFHPTTKGHAIIAEYAQNSDRLEYGAPVTLTMPHVANIEIRNMTYAGTISGTGSMIKQGEAILTLAGLNSYTGGTRIDAGTVRVSSDDNLGARSGLLTLRGGALSASASFSMRRDVSITNAGGTFDADRNVTLTLVDNTISGDGNLTKTGAGVLDLRSTMNTSANGQTVAVAGVGRQLTTLAGGTLKINTTNPYITYRMETKANTVLAGSGTIITGRSISGGGVVAAGLLAPGNSIGTLTIDGDLVLADSSVYQLEVDSAQSDQLVVTGSLTLDGNVSVVTDPDDKIISQTFTIGSASGAVSGTYDEVEDLSPFLFETIHHGANTVSISFTRDFAAPAVTSNQRAVAAHLNAAYLPIDQGDLDDVFYGLDTTGTNAAGANALDQLSGVSIGNLLTSSAIQRGQFTRALEDRMSGRRAGRDTGTVAAGTSALSFGQDNSGLGGVLADSSSAMSQAAPNGTRDADGVSAWARVLGGPATIGGTGAYDMTGVGVLLGVDKSFGAGLAGLSLGYGTFNNDGSNGGNGNADTYQISVYGSLQQGNLFLDGTLAYAYADYSTSRTLAFGSLYRMASGSADGNDVTLSLKAGGVYGFGGLAFEPSLGFDWYHLTRSAFTETGAGSAGLMVGSQNLDLLMPSVGFRLSSLFNAGTFTVTPELSARYYYNFGDTDVATTAGLIGAPAAPFTVEGTGIGRNIGVLAAGLSAQEGNNLRVSTQYELQVSDDVTAHVFSAGLKYTW